MIDIGVVCNDGVVGTYVGGIWGDQMLVGRKGDEWVCRGDATGWLGMRSDYMAARETQGFIDDSERNLSFHERETAGGTWQPAVKTYENLEKTKF